MKEPLFNMLQQKGLLMIVIDESQIDHLTLDQVKTWIKGSKAEQQIKALEENPLSVITSIGNRTDEQILLQTNQLAIMFLAAMGFEVEDPSTMVCNLETTRAANAWSFARSSQLLLTQTDVNDCLYLLDEMSVRLELLENEN